MGDLAITQWTKEINQEIEATESLIAPLHHLGKHEWAEQLTDEVRLMRDAIQALQRIGQSQGRRLGRPPLWLRATSEPSNPEVKHRKRKPPEKQGDI